MVVLHGCAGERDATKRAEMSEAALRHGDIIFLTSDNPRAEPEGKDICRRAAPAGKSGQALQGGGGPVKRRRARPWKPCGRSDLLALCGKGHEDYQVLNGRTVFLDEKFLVEGWLAERETGLRKHCLRRGILAALAL